MEPSTSRHARLSAAIADRALPAALVDLDLLDRNLDALVVLARAGQKPLRLATKSVRCVALLRYALARGEGTLRGLMAFSAHEALALAGAGFNDLLVAYPVARAPEAEAIAAACATGAVVRVVADDARQLAPLQRAAKAAGVTIDVLVDVDVSLRLVRDRVHLGVRRSPVRTPAAVVALAERIAATEGLRFAGVMAYEAQIAGVADDVPGDAVRGAALRWMKRQSREAVERTRAEVRAALTAHGLAPTVFNGGGTGSLAWCSHEPALTEVTAGSGLLGGTLFDHYRSVRPEGALLFALSAVRSPTRGVVTCAGGGYVASGAAGVDRLPQPVLPEGCTLLPMEGAGEVQTPVRLPEGCSLRPGEPVFFRHAKPGELAERFARYLLVRGDKVEREVPTYRGEGWCFG